MKKIKYLIIIMCLFLLTTGCNKEEVIDNKDNDEKNEYSELLNYKEALTIFIEDKEAEILDIETGITYKVKRVIGGYNTLADVETLTEDDTNKLLQTAGGDWNIKRRAVIITVDGKKIAASIAPFQHSGSEEHVYGEVIDNRTGGTGTGINLDSIRNNGMIGVVDVYFYNSLTPGVNRVDERHQEMVLKAYEYEG